MKVRVGTVICSDFGTGPVVAITKQWIIHQIDKGSEVCLSREDDFFWIPDSGIEIGGGQDMEIELPDE